MNQPDIQHALEQVRSLQDICLQKQRFYGYSGKARIASGVLALVTAAVLALAFPDAGPYVHLMGWGLLLLAGLLVNYVALAFWFWFDEEVERDVVRLKPAIEAVPPLTVGAFLTVAFVWTEAWMFLMPVWMMGFGLANLASRHFLERTIGLVGLYYVICGALVLFVLPNSFLTPWPMGIVFFGGELVGGLLMWKGTQRAR